MGIRYDRQWMFADDRGMFVAQRGRSSGDVGIEVRTLCLVGTTITGDALVLTAPNMPPLHLPLDGPHGPSIDAQVWDSHVTGVDQGAEADAWATEYLSRERRGRYRLLRMSDDADRAPKQGTGALAYADAYSFLVIAEQSLADLNARLGHALPMNRFRPNLVLRGCAPYAEDDFASIRIGDVLLDGTTRCLRCPIPTTNQETGERGKEPLRTLATYRRTPDGVVFGRNFNHRGTGMISLGDTVIVSETHDDVA